MYEFAGSAKELEEYLDKTTVKLIMNRLSKQYSDEVETFILEDKYIDAEWRNEYSLFYSKTFYDEISKFTKRIHLISKDVNSLDKVREENYLGYIVLRPINIEDPEIPKILKIIVKPRKNLFNIKNNESLYLAKCPIPAHLGEHDTTFLIESFPFYEQDSVVTACAHADMWMVAEYMHRRFGFNKPTIEKLVLTLAPVHGRVIPTRGLILEQVCQTLNSLGYSTSIRVGLTEEEKNKILDHVDSYLESGLPTILYHKHHVIVITGHTLDGDQRDYIIYDDSGAHLSKLLGLSESSIPPFAARISRRKLFNYIKGIGHTIAINIEFEKLFYPHESVSKYTNLFFEEFSKKIVQKAKTRYNYTEEKTKKFSKALNKYFKSLRKRFLIADSREFKRFCIKNGIDAFKDIPLPHYIWIVEIYKSGNKPYGILILDASAYKYDFTSSLIAKWIGNKIDIVRPKKKECKVNTTPKIYSNLSPVLV